MLEQLEEYAEETRHRAEEMFGSSSTDLDEEIEPIEGALAFTLALGATALARRALRKGWKTATQNDPPKDLTSDQVSWKQAVVWGVVSGAVVGVVQIASRRASAGVYRSWRR